MSEGFSKVIAAKDTYKTEIDGHSSSSILPTFAFYSRLVKIIFKGNRQAVKGFYDDVNWVNSSLDVLHALECAGVKITVEGMDNLKKFEGPAVIIGNHMSAMETMIPVGMIHPVRRFVYIVKKELANFPLFGAVVMARDPIVVGRSNPRDDLKIVMDEGSERLSRNKSILIFPQKTRQLEFDRKSFNTLGVKLAQRNNVPVIPMAVLTDAWANGKKLKDFGKIDPAKHVYISFGEPINVSGKGQEEHEQVLDFIGEKLNQWGRGELVI